MSLFAVAVVIILGIILLLLEFLVVPGVTVVGIAGFLLMIFGLVASYHFHGPQVGLYTMGITTGVSIVTIYYIFKQKTWKKVGLKSSIDSRHSPFDISKVHPGDSGMTITRLAPIGKVKVNDIICEGKSISGFIDENTHVEVTKVLNTQLIVKPKI